MVGKKVFIPRYSVGDTVELIYFYLIKDSGNERITFHDCLTLLHCRKVKLSDIGIMKQWVIIKEVIEYGDKAYGYIASADLHTNKLNILIAHNQYPNYDYTIKDMGTWKVFYLNLTRGCKPKEYIYETLSIVKDVLEHRKHVPKTFLKKILGEDRRSGRK